MGTLTTLSLERACYSVAMKRSTGLGSISRSSLLQSLTGAGSMTASESSKTSASNPWTLVGATLKRRGGGFGVTTAALILRKTDS